MDVTTPKTGQGQEVVGNLTVTKLLFMSSSAGLTASTVRTQAGALPLLTEYNRVDTATAPAATTLLGDGVALMPSVAGLDVVLVNNTLFPVQVYGAVGTTDTVNSVAGATGISMPPGAVYLFVAAAPGSWQVEGIGTGSAGIYPTVSTLDGLTARAGGGQGSAWQVAAQMSRFTVCATAADSSILPNMKAGMNGIVIINAGAASMNVFPAVGEQINSAGANVAFALPASKTATFNCTLAGASHAQLSA